jgi:hypothetical protein
MANMSLVELEQGFKVLAVEKSDDHYKVISTTGDTLISEGKPINCTGFNTNLGPVTTLFDTTAEGLPKVNKFDESTF